MAYRIEITENPQEAVRRIAREQIDKAIDEVKDTQLDGHETVHQVRKRCKKIRGLIRLVRPQMEGAYDLENDWYRDSARMLSYVRDAQSIIETYDTLMQYFGDQIRRSAFAPIRRQLTRRRKQVTEDEIGLQGQLHELLERMQEGRKRVSIWHLPDNGFEAVEGGLTKTYRRGCDAMQAAYEDPTSENFHEWRKRAKYHWYHMRLLANVWPGPVKERRDEADQLSTYLGDDHDLAILRETLTENPEHFGDEGTVQSMIDLANQRQVELRLKARWLGARLYTEKPKRFTGRLGAYWRAWRSEKEADPQATHEPDLVTP